MKPTEFIIDKEFKSLIPPHSKEEVVGLHASIDKHGCMDCIVVWKWKNIILDGHNRFAYCEKKGIGYNVREIELKDREDAKQWMIAHQLARRNLTPESISFLRGLQYNAQKLPVGGDHKSNGQNVRLIQTAETLANEHGVSERTIRRDGEFAEALDKVSEAVPEIKDEVLSGNSELTPTDIKQIAELPKRSQPKAVRDAKRKELKAIREASAKAAEAGPSEDNPITDRNDYPIPKKLLDAFEDAFLRDALKQLRETTKLLRSAHNWNPWLNIEVIVESSKELMTTIQQNLPHAVHQRCNGNGCKDCRNVGFVPKWRMDEMKTHKEFA